MIRNIFISTLLSLKAHKLRVFLTMLGIIIGIASVVTIAALGEGLRQETLSLADSANTNQIRMQYMPEMTEDYMYTGESDFAFNRADMKRIQKMDGVESVTPDYGEWYGMGNTQEMISTEATYFGQYAYLQLSPDQQLEEQIMIGRSLTNEDANKNVIVLSHEALDYGFVLDNPEKLIGQAISINGYMYKVVGIKEPYDFDAIQFSDQDYMASMTSNVPRSSYNELTRFKPFSALSIIISEGADRYAVADDIAMSLTEYYPEETGYFEEDRSNEQMIQEMESYMSAIIGFLMAITTISLLVGGIGVMNIMYVSVTERKKEIGIRRAIGAKPRSILLQFILEAAFITFIGGIIGLTTGYGLAVLVGSYMQLTPVLTVNTIVLASSVSILTGLFFGIMPSVSAAKMDPIKAIYQ